MQRYCNPCKAPPEPPKVTPSTSITQQQLPAYPYPGTPTSSVSLTHLAPSSAPPSIAFASVRITRRKGGLHAEHHTGATIFGACPNGELRTLADTVTATPPPTTIRPCNIWVVVDAMADIDLTKRLTDLPLHRAPESGLTTQALGLWIAFRGMHPLDALQIVKQESHCYTYSNGRADTHAKHQNTNHTPRLEHVRLDGPHSRDKQYHYHTPIQQLANTLSHPANTELLQRLKDSVCTPLYYSALRPDSLPAHLQKP